MGNIFSISLSCDTLLSRCWDCAAGQAIYICKLEENLVELKTALDELKERRNDIVRKVKIAEQGNMEPLEQVKGWLSRTEDMIKEVDPLISDGPLEINKLCLGGCCSKNCKSSHKFSKRVAKRLPIVKDQNFKGTFEEVATAVPTPLVVERPSDSAIGLESMFNKVWGSLEEKHVGIIGIYGLGGVGKTRLLIEINNKIGVSSGGFDAVIWAVVSKGFYIGKVQDEIAKEIGLRGGTWADKTSEEKAIEIFEVLKKKKFVLLLDDIWERVDLSKVGIPRPTPENGSKLIFTTRSIQVCGQMRAHKKIEVTCLPDKKAWQLFEEHVGKDLLDSHPNIRDIAKEVAKECGGLPLALITIGRAMAYKTTSEEWKYAIDVLRSSSAMSISSYMGEEVYQLLKYSYDSLSNDTVRSCLLYCSLFPEDFEIQKERLIDCWIGEGFLDEHDNISLVRNQGHYIIGSLTNACLLGVGGHCGSEYVKMHDVIRDMCLWIACTYEAEKWKFYVQSGHQLTKVPDIEKWRGVQRMSLMGNKIKSISEAPNCPDLRTLFLSGNEPLKLINNDFFQFMCALKVFDLSGNRAIKEFPMGITKLVSLEYLDLSGTRIRELPIELEALEKLKCFNLEYTYTQINIPKGLMSSFSELKILRMYDSFPFDKAVEDDKEFLAEELKCLKHLNVLTLSTRSAFALDRIMSVESLHNFIQKISLDSLRDLKELNILSFANLKSLNRLSIRRCESLDEVKIMWEGEGRMVQATTEIQTSVIASVPRFQSLHLVFITKCSKLRDITWLILAPNLKYFLVADCAKMEEIINEKKLRQVAAVVRAISPFSGLKDIRLRRLPELKSIYPNALPLSCMKAINIERCPKLRRLPLNSNSAKGNKMRITGEEKWWAELQWEDESTQNTFLPTFKRQEL